MFINSGKVTLTLGKYPSVMTTKKELKKDAVREEWKNLIAHSLRITEIDWTKKDS